MNNISNHMQVIAAFWELFNFNIRTLITLLQYHLQKEEIQFPNGRIPLFESQNGRWVAQRWQDNSPNPKCAQYYKLVPPFYFILILLDWCRWTTFRQRHCCKSYDSSRFEFNLPLVELFSAVSISIFIRKTSNKGTVSDRGFIFPYNSQKTSEHGEAKWKTEADDQVCVG